jgi:glycosyltransferase involved in cell wall biosynthesis
MGKAKGVFVPTQYCEPFGGVAVEAQLCGTPVITTDFGAFTETVEHGKTGYRCHTLDHFVWAANNVGKLDPNYIRARAVANYSMSRVRYQFEEFFNTLYDLWGAGWPTLHPERTQLDWLNKQ